jgi:hypothetical protein
MCELKCIFLIRILQKDVYKNKYDLITKLCENIENIEKNTNENSVQNIYMCKKMNINILILLNKNIITIYAY